MTDKFQTRYIKHQDKKRRTLIKLMADRHSTRVFSDKAVSDKHIKTIIHSVSMCPSSCDRQAISVDIHMERDDKQLLGGLLVGGVGWIHRAPVIMTIWANPVAYKEGLGYMPYLDAGVVIEQIYLICEALGLKCCYCNPNVREKHKSYFDDAFNKEGKVYCGAFGIGYE